MARCPRILLILLPVCLGPTQPSHDDTHTALWSQAATTALGQFWLNCSTDMAVALERALLEAISSSSTSWAFLLALRREALLLLLWQSLCVPGLH